MRFTTTVLLGIWIATNAGCDEVMTLTSVAEAKPSDAGRIAAAEEDQAVVVPDGPVELLIQLVQKAQTEADELAQLLAASAANQQVRIANLKRQIDHGVTATERLDTNGDATELQRQWARQAKLSLLYQGAKHEPSEFLPRLKQYASELRQDDPQGQLTAVGAAFVIELESLSMTSPNSDPLPMLIEYAKQFPKCGAGVTLFQRYGEQLERTGRHAEASECYRQGVVSYSKHPAAASLKVRYDRIGTREKANVERHEARQRKLSQIRRKLGDRDDGYFVVYAHEVKDDAKGFSLYKFQYEVLHGREAAAMFIDGLASNWQWDLIQRFPDSPGAYQQASALAEELTKKRAFIKF